MQRGIRDHADAVGVPSRRSGAQLEWINWRRKLGVPIGRCPSSRIMLFRKISIAKLKCPADNADRIVVCLLTPLLSV
jgi:hypothetical protein